MPEIRSPTLYAWDQVTYFVWLRSGHLHCILEIRSPTLYAWGIQSRWPYLRHTKCSSPLVYLLRRRLDYWVFQSFDYDRTWKSLFQKRVMRTKFDIYVFIEIYKRGRNFTFYVHVHRLSWCSCALYLRHLHFWLSVHLSIYKESPFYPYFKPDQHDFAQCKHSNNMTTDLSVHVYHL
jgi:hypothetical protein